MRSRSVTVVAHGLLMLVVSGIAEAQSSGEPDLFDSLAQAVRAVPAREIERRRRVARLADSRLDATHPPTGSRIELLEATTPDSPIRRFLDTRGPGIHHLCLRSGDVRAADAALRAAGYRVLREQPTRGAGGCWVQFVHPRSTGGVLLELSEGGAEDSQAASQTV